MLLSILHTLWQKNLVLKCLIIICLPLIVLSFLNPGTIFQKIDLYLIFILLFSVFDSYGFSLTQDRDNEWSELRIIYRIIQDMFEVILLWGVFWAGGGWPVVIACITAHWCTACDKLFYILRQEPDYAGEYTWLEGWSVFLILKHFGIKPIGVKTFNLAALAGFGVGVIICLL